MSLSLRLILFLLAVVTAAAVQKGEVETRVEKTLPATPSNHEQKQISRVAESPVIGESCPKKEGATSDCQGATSGNLGSKLFKSIRRHLSKEKAESKEETSTESEFRDANAQAGKEQGLLTKLIGRVFESKDSEKKCAKVEETQSMADSEVGSGVEQTQSIADSEVGSGVEQTQSIAESTVVSEEDVDENEVEKDGHSKPFLRTIADFIVRIRHKAERETTVEPVEGSRATDDVSLSIASETQENAATTADQKINSPSKRTALLGAICKKTTGFVHSLKEKAYKEEKKFPSEIDEALVEEKAEGEGTEVAKDNVKKEENTQAKKNEEKSKGFASQTISFVKTSLYDVREKDTDKKKKVIEAQSGQQETEVVGPTTPTWKKRVSEYFVTTSSGRKCETNGVLRVEQGQTSITKEGEKASSAEKVNTTQDKAGAAKKDEA